MGKFKMPKAKEFLKRKRIYGPKPDPVWVYLEREMMQNIDKKPYNNKVGTWLKFCRDLRHYFYKEGKRKYRRLEKEAGPPWYYEMSSDQRRVLQNLRIAIHEDLIQGLPVRVRQSLAHIGVTLRFPTDLLMKAMEDSIEDPGVFIWNLFTAYYKVPPSTLLPKYNVNSMLLMSCLVFIDLEDCIKELEKVTERQERPPKPKKKPPPKYFEPNVKYGEYLQKMYVPCYSNHPLNPRKGPRKPMPLKNKIKLRTHESYENLRLNLEFIEKRKEKNKKAQQVERVCHYKFWEPPTTLRNTDPKMAAYVLALKMFKKKAKPRYLKQKPPFDNLQCHIGNVSYSGGTPRFILNNYCTMATGYIPLNGGVVRYGNEYVTYILGYWKYPRDYEDKCDSDCGCLTKWEGKILDYLKDSKCKCGHNYDMYNEGKAKEKFFYPPKRCAPFWLDHAKIYQLDPMEDFIKDTVRDALASTEPTTIVSEPSVSLTGLKPRELVAALLADIADTHLMIPHMPLACDLKNLQEWARKRIKGELSPKNHKRLALQSQRRWLDLKHIDFRARAYMIPFTLKELDKMKFCHKKTINKMSDNLLESFQTRNKIKQVEQARLWWATMHADAYPSKAFVDVFFSYLPGRLKDTYVINPYSPFMETGRGGKTCPLSF